MKKQIAKFENIMKKAVKHMVDTEQYGWPPQCSTFLYQPIRPTRIMQDQVIKRNKAQEKECNIEV